MPASRLGVVVDCHGQRSRRAGLAGTSLRSPRQRHTRAAPEAPSRRRGVQPPVRLTSPTHRPRSQRGISVTRKPSAGHGDGGATEHFTDEQRPSIHTCCSASIARLITTPGGQNLVQQPCSPLRAKSRNSPLVQSASARRAPCPGLTSALGGMPAPPGGPSGCTFTPCPP